MPVDVHPAHRGQVLARGHRAAAANEADQRGIQIGLARRQGVAPRRVELGGDDRGEGFLGILPAGIDDLDVAAELLLERRGRVAAHLQHLVVHRGVAEVRRPRHVQPPDVLLARLEIGAGLAGQRDAIAVVTAGDDVEGQGRIAHGAGQGAEVADVVPPREAHALRNPPVGRLEADQPAQRRRNADRAAAVRAETDGPESGGHRGRRAAARAARCALEIPRVARGAEERIVGERLVAELRGVGLAEDDRAGRAQATHRDGVFFRDQVGEEPGAAGGAQAARVEHVLQRHRYSVEWTERLALHHRDLRLAGHDAGEGGRHQAIGIETRVELLDTSEQSSGQLDGGQLLVADQRGDLERRPPGEILVNQGTLLGTDRHCIIRLVGEVAGAEILRDARGRRIGERDRWGGDVAHLTWTRDDALGEAAVRLPDGAWLFIHPGAARDARWGPSDVLRLGDSEAPLTHFASVNWAAIDAIPPLAEPARLPPGAGTAVLNLIAALAVDQGRTRLAYRVRTPPSSSSSRCSRPSGGRRTTCPTIPWRSSWPAG